MCCQMQADGRGLDFAGMVRAEAGCVREGQEVELGRKCRLPGIRRVPDLDCCLDQ